MNRSTSKTIDNLQATIERLRRELELTREETQHALAEVKKREKTLEKIKQEADAKKNDINQLKMQAEEVVRRKNLQEKIVQLQEELLLERREREATLRQLEEQREELAIQKENILIDSQKEIADVRSQARVAWQRAEEEISRLDEEVDRLTIRLENEKLLRTSAEVTIVKLEATLARIRKNSGQSGNEFFDKHHFDNLLKKAHLAIKSLQEQLTHTTAERDQYLTQIDELRQSLASSALLSPTGDPIYAPLSPSEKSAPSPSSEVKPSTPEINFNQPLFDDNINDELLLIEPDQSFNHDDKLDSSPSSLLSQNGSHAAQRSSDPTDPSHSATQSDGIDSPTDACSDSTASSRLSTSKESAPSDQSIAELARELLNESRSLSGVPPLEARRSNRHQKASQTPPPWHAKIDSINLSWRRIAWASFLSFVILVIATAVYDRFFGEGMGRAELQALQIEAQRQIRIERRAHTLMRQDEEQTAYRPQAEQFAPSTSSSSPHEPDEPNEPTPSQN